MFTSIFGIAVIKQVPPLRVSIIAGASSSAGKYARCENHPVRHHAFGHLLDHRYGLFAEDWCPVAPKNSAESRLNSTGSTAITALAPAARAPCTAFMPTPPVPR